PAKVTSPMRKARATDNRCLSIFTCRPGFSSVFWLSAENASRDNSHNPTGEEAQAHGILFPDRYPENFPKEQPAKQAHNRSQTSSNRQKNVQAGSAPVLAKCARKTADGHSRNAENQKKQQVNCFAAVAHGAIGQDQEGRRQKSYDQAHEGKGEFFHTVEKSENRISKSETISKSESQSAQVFEFRHSNLFRISTFEFRVYPTKPFTDR